MESRGVIFEGKTLDDAVRKGLDALGLARAEVMIQVMEEGSSGFLGIGARPYRVRMMPRPRRETSERSERGERSERRSGRGDRERGGRGGRDRDRQGRGERGAGERRGRGERADRGPRAEGGERSDRGGRPERGGRREREGPPREAQAEPAARGGEPREAEAGREPRRIDADGEHGGRRRRRRGGGGRNGGEGGRDRERAPRPEHEAGEAVESRADGRREPREPREDNGPIMPPDELVATSKRLAEDFFQHMGFDAQVSAHAEGDSVEVKAEIAQDSELITGEKGEVRQSIQHILNRMLNRGGTTHYHLQLEINDFWAQRESELQEMARRLADEAVSEGSEKLTEYLNAQERRVVHVALREDPRVRTFGIGDGLIKKVAIAPAGSEEDLKPDE